MFETVLAPVGLGAARIDLKLDQAEVHAGEIVTGHFLITGGKAEQDIEGLSVFFMMESHHAKSLGTILEKIATIHISKDEFELDSGEVRKYPFQFQCPDDLPPSSVNTKYFFISNLEIKHAMDAHDRDFLKVRPSKKLENYYLAMKQLGFKQIGEGLIPSEDGSFAQWIQYRPTTYFYGKFEEISFYYSQYKNQKEIQGVFDIVWKEKNASSYLSFLQQKEQTHSFTLTEETLRSEEITKQTIEAMIRQELVNNQS
ncbi:sporulation protein [Risungbinella massiliensis]|uniref:sporulation protein n=1 Tax=Risungbinella massiliensis TaxID=1329796 RepID=UPI0005CC3FB3|nr:sporulation protein [Risungbinella massiliensis]